MSNIEDRALTEAEAAKFLGCSTTTLRIQRCKKTLANRMKPVPYFRMGPRMVRYSLADLIAYRDSCRVQESENEPCAE